MKLDTKIPKKMYFILKVVQNFILYMEIRT